MQNFKEHKPKTKLKHFCVYLFSSMSFDGRYCLFESPKDILYSDRGISYTDVWIGENSSGYIYLKSVHFKVYKLYQFGFFFKKKREEARTQ